MNKTIFKGILLLVAFLMFVTGCSTDVGWSNKSSAVPHFESKEELLAAKEEAVAAYDNAYADFFAEMEGAGRSRAMEATGELEPSQWGLRERLIALAYECYNTGDMAKFEDFLKANNLYERFKTVIERNRLDYHSRVLAVPTGVTMGGESRRISNKSFFDRYLDGDILLCYGGGGSSGAVIGFLIPGNPWKHAGVLDRSRPWRNDPEHCVLAAGQNTSHGFAVGYESRTNWMKEKSVSVWRVRGRNIINSRRALDYGRIFLGKGFNFFTSRENDSSWYCSKIVYRAWLSQGKQLEQKGWFMDFWVTPTDLAEDGDTYWVGGDRR